MNISKLVLKRQLRLSSQLTNLHHKYASTNTEERIEIPKRIPRGPTDILRALESTVSRDPTASHYKYHDDPYLIPMSNITKRTFAMAKEAGKKAAHWVRQEHSDLFNHRECDPPIEAFFPKVVYNEDSEVTEDDLRGVIKNAQVSDAILVFGLLKDKNVEVSEESKQKLLDLVCYFNSTDPLNEEFIEERWFRQTTNLKNRQRKTWNDGGFAESLFLTIENPSPEAYNSIIQGMAKYFQADKAWNYFQHAQERNVVLSVESYNSIIRISSFLKESYEMRWLFVTDLLIGMEKAGLRPNLNTLNAVLHVLSGMGIGKANKENVLKVLSEFKSLGIEPSLGSWYYVLITFCKERGPISTILNDIMNEVGNKEFQIKDICDTYFFVTAMDICRNHLNNVELARRVDNLLHFGNNYDLIGDSYKESIYYRHYLLLLIKSIPLEEFMNNIYFKLVPHVYVPEPSVMKEIVTEVDLNAAIEYIPKLWSDIVIFDHVNRPDIVELIFASMVNNKPDDANLQEHFSRISWELFQKIENADENRYNKFSPTGDLLGKMMILLLRNNEFEKADLVMNKLDKGQTSIVGVPQIEALSMFVDACIAEKSPKRAINCIQYCSDSGFAEASVLAARLNEKLTLDENHLNSLSSIIGSVALGVKSEM